MPKRNNSDTANAGLRDDDRFKEPNIGQGWSDERKPQTLKKRLSKKEIVERKRRGLDIENELEL